MHGGCRLLYLILCRRRNVLYAAVLLYLSGAFAEALSGMLLHQKDGNLRVLLLIKHPVFMYYLCDTYVTPALKALHERMVSTVCLQGRGFIVKGRNRDERKKQIVCDPAVDSDGGLLYAGICFCRD